MTLEEAYELIVVLKSETTLKVTDYTCFCGGLISFNVQYSGNTAENEGLTLKEHFSAEDCQ